MSETKVSFAKVPGAGESAAVPPTKAPDANATVVDPNTKTPPQNLPATSTTPSSLSTRFSGGDDDDEEQDNSDVKLPRINIIQGLSAPELKALGPDGTIVFKKNLVIPQPARIVVAAMTKPVYVEKPAVFGKGDRPRIFNTLNEVIDNGGTDLWRNSRENKEAETFSKKPLYQKMSTILLLIQKWEGISPADEEHFQAIAEDGTAFAAAVYTVKGTSFKGLYVPVKSENAQGVLSDGYYCRYIKLTTRQQTAWEPLVSIQEPTSEAVRKLARSLRT
jgi:hypothetical protein